MVTATTTLQGRAQLNPTAQCLPTDLHNDLEQPTCQKETCHLLRVSSHRVTNSVCSPYLALAMGAMPTPLPPGQVMRGERGQEIGYEVPQK